MENVRTSTPANPKLLLRMLIGALLGAGVGYSTVSAAVTLHISPNAFSWFDWIALWLGIVFIASGIVAFFISTNRRRLARTLEGDEAALPATTGEVRSFQLQAATLALAGIMILIPPFATGSLAAHRLSSPAVSVSIFAVVAILFLLQTAVNIRLWRDSDEFARGLMLSICALTFVVGQGLLFLYAAAERLHLVHQISSWDVITLLLSLYWVVAASISLRYQR